MSEQNTEQAVSSTVLPLDSVVRVEVRTYGDRGDPSPPNDHRVELFIGDLQFVQCYGEFTTKEKANSLAQELRRFLAHRLGARQ